MCAEHSKDPKPDDNEVCGCPLNPETFYEMDLNTIATCRTAKKLCRKHLLWEKMYRAEIDLKVSFLPFAATHHGTRGFTPYGFRTTSAIELL